MGPDTSTDGTPTESEQRGPETDAAPWAVYLRDVGTSVGAVVLVGLFLFAVSGVWPPLVAIESGSMEPHIDTGDMVFIMDEERFPGPDARHGVVTAERGSGTGYRTFERSGDVIVFEPNGNERRTPVIHRAMFWVEDGENWYDRADDDAVGSADSCRDLRNCPAPHSGFVTKGDHNGAYDQVTGTSTVVRPTWVVGTGVVRIPRLGFVRLWPTAGDELSAAVAADAPDIGAASGREPTGGSSNVTTEG
ncbi:S24/S26 family peptidase [Haloarcula salina]|uniref:S26 family signal peptidase n=1 Tax=Haloarcula salina TaxID=1429914 RepID=A0AA41G137_9EURY|nr:S26 family signal peptidase [Haloarcula salina]MBV0902323.1 S26 family signal peptidase [Haloarcula salina]